MTKQFLLAVSIFSFSVAQAQSTFNVDFNNYVSATNNDLKNNFTGSFTLTQQTTNGITGGSVLPTPTFTSNKAWYNVRSYLRPSDPNQTSVSISFKYSASAATSTDGGAEVGFMLTSDSVGSTAAGFVTTTVEKYPFGGFDISIDGSVDHYSSLPFSLVDGHWYQLQLKIKALDNDNVSASTYVYDLGASGTSSPSLVSSFLDKNQATAGGITWPHSFFIATLNGAANGGVVAMDNFSLNSYFAPSGIKEVGLLKEITVTNPVTNKLSVTTVCQDAIQFVIYNTSGAKVMTGILNGSADIDVSSLPASLYLIQFSSKENAEVKKFVKE